MKIEFIGRGGAFSSDENNLNNSIILEENFFYEYNRLWRNEFSQNKRKNF